LLRRVVWWLDTNLSEDYAASALRFYETLVSNHRTTRRSNPENQELYGVFCWT